ncbi:diacylglycerol/lipid kinase family protein [Lentilactobacillus sp. SPB1-3]|uniref:Diacylglycerol kinase family protein n=1 Tax=Lentilactobacillus terminaliae TaxID=3003483 RepID=A0ACD5DDU4_9LACO|nr:diacylglycerol kinase family protein [Lentilactobacillus sp. SPB1-3]MCZ0977853.1 diacylglycerol kinase family lipid kinase [Lentilactobacillus sp. SPB1-3]
MPKHFVFIVNEAAGGGNVRKLWPKIVEQLNQLNIEYRCTKTNFVGDAIQITKRILSAANDRLNNELVIVATGGDGTLHEVLNGCKEFYESHPSPTQVPIAFLPIGSGNDFARALKISDNWKTAIQQILSVKSPKPLVVGKYNNLNEGSTGYFINNFGIGLDATIVHNANHSIIKRNPILGKFSYIFAALNVIRTFKPVKTEVYYGENNQFVREFTKGFLITVTNIPYFGGGVNIVPTASPSKNSLDLVLIEKPSVRQIIIFIINLLAKRHLKLKFVTHLSKKSFTIITDGNRFGQIDGEESSSQSFNIKFETSTYSFWVN